jgi:type I restriction enzyme, S subunit
VSRLHALIAAPCPSVTEFRALEEVGVLYNGLTGKSKADFADGNARFVTYMNVFNSLAANVLPDDFVQVADGERQNRIRYGDVLFTASSESAEEVGMASGVTLEPPEPLYLNSFCFGFRPESVELDPEFAKHLFRSTGIRRQIIRTANGVTRINISKQRFRAIKIPVPPLEVQRDLAAILDKFHALVSDLSIGLPAELNARRQQYEHYRSSLLTFTYSHRARSTPLGDLVDFTNGKPHERLVDPDGDIALMTSKFISTQGRSARFVRSSDVLTAAHRGEIAMVMSDLPNGRALARAFYVDSDDRYAANQRVCLLRVRDPQVVDSRFLFYMVDRNKQLLSYDSGVDQTHLKKGDILAIEIPVPTLSEQRRIVATLDKFDALVNDISVGLPAELSARRKQYEYYRDRLLTFAEVA